METAIVVLIIISLISIALWLIACKESRYWEQEFYDETRMYQQWKDISDKETELLKLYAKELSEEFRDIWGVSQSEKKCIKNRCMKRAKAKMKKMESEK